jgi:hypothetical protein
MSNVPTDRIIAIGLVATCVIYAISSIVLSVPISEALLGTVLGGLIGVLKGSDQRRDAGGDQPRRDSEAVKKEDSHD